MCSSDFRTSKNLLSTLKPSFSPSTPPLDPELSFLQHEIYIEYLIATSQYPLAFSTLTALSKVLKDDGADLFQRVSVLLMQADLWRRVGKPERGFSVALRAASVSFRARFAPGVWGAVGALGAVLNALGECKGARRIVEGVLPSVCLFVPTPLEMVEDANVCV